jgi:two-component system, LytTR family, sensor kinase
MEATCSHERGVSRAAGYAALRSVSTSPDASAAHRGHRPFDGRRLRRIALLIAAACLVPAVLDGWQFYLQAKLAGEASVSWRFVAFQAGEWIILGALMSLVWTMAVRFPFDRPHLGARVAAHLGGALLLCAGWALCGVALRAALGLLPGDEPLARHLAGWLLTSLPWSVFMYFAMLGCLLAFAYFTEAREREAAAARLTAQVAEARLAALRAQIHPHFLFNSLNAVAVLARDGRTTDAVRVVEQLSDLLRELLAGDDTATVPLAREIAFVEKYLSIESTRFPDRLEVRWEVAPEALATPVPTSVLQPLVENALRHGVAARTAPTRVTIRAEISEQALDLAVSNDAADPATRASTRGRGVGLANLEERLAALYGGEAALALDQGAHRVTARVRLPRRRSSP